MVLRAPAAFESLINTTLDAFGLLSSASSKAGTSIEIRQLEGSARKTVLLRDRAMPYQEPEFETELLTKKTVYPGNPRATQQVLAPTDNNTTFEGMWKDRFLRSAVLVNGDGGAVTNVDELQQLFDGLIRAGKLVRVQWLSFVRVGLIRRFTVAPLRATDIKWELEFEWQSREEVPARRSVSLETPGPNDLLALLNTIEDIVTLAPELMANFNAIIVSSIRDIGDKLGKIVDLLRVAEAIISLPAQIEGAMRAAALALVRQVQELTRRLSDRWTESPMGKAAALMMASSVQSSTGTGTKSSALTSQAQYAAWSRSLVLSLDALAFAVQRAYQGIVDRLVPQGGRTTQMPADASLYLVAEQLYGSSDFANYLANVNGLSSVNVPAGFILKAPGRPFGALGSIEMSGGAQSGAPGSL
jgi:hypothetical protein